MPAQIILKLNRWKSRVDAISKQYQLFISHCWDYSEDYENLIALLKNAPNFNYHNFSVTKADPLIARNREALKREITKQISPASIVIILAGMYAHYSGWVPIEMDIARTFGKPIIGVVPWGQQITPKAVQTAVIKMVNWQTTSIVKAIREYSI